MTTTLDRVKKLFLENFDFPGEHLHPESTLESIGLDSLDQIECLFALEKEFNIKIPDREVKLNSIKDMSGMITVIEDLIAAQQAKQEQRA